MADAVDKVLRPAIAQIVTIHRGNDDVFELERSNGFRQIMRLVRIQRVGTPVTHVAKRATAGAFVAHNHERGRTFAKAFADIRA